MTERGDCLMTLGRLYEAAVAYEEAIRRDEKRGAERDVAVEKGNLGTVRMFQRRYREALEAHEDARERFIRLNEPGMVAVSWHQTGSVYQEMGQPEAAEDAYRQSLAGDRGAARRCGWGRRQARWGNWGCYTTTSWAERKKRSFSSARRRTSTSRSAT